MNVRRWWSLLRLVLLGLAVGFVAIQFVPVERSNPPVKNDLEAPVEIKQILRRSCYDCHSHETRWPWYSHVAPVSWWITDHVEHGRGDLNFSDWPSFDFVEQELERRDIEKQIVKGEMPLRSYLILHPEARLDEEERELLLRWARTGF